MRSLQAAHHPAQEQDELTWEGVLRDPRRERMGENCQLTSVMETLAMAKPLGGRGSSDQAKESINEVKCQLLPHAGPPPWSLSLGLTPFTPFRKFC